MIFRHLSSCLVVGPSQSVKTFLIRRLLHNRRILFEPNVKSIKWCYIYSASWFLEEPEIEFIEELPETYEEGDLLVIDDMMHCLTEKIADIFTAANHHKNMSVILVLQNMFRARK